MSSEVNLLLEKATSPLLLEIDWDSTLHIVDLIRQGDVSEKQAINSILARLKDSNPNVVLLGIQVLESVVKNCGQAVHETVSNHTVMEQVEEIIHSNPNDEVRKKLLRLLATWTYAFRNEPKYRAVQDTVNILKAKGYTFPPVIESDAMFTADRAPDWADGECCHRCRYQFTMIRRKHHCRACGQVFCGDCSNKYSTIPKFGIEREVRVCEPCYEDINNPQVLTPATKTGGEKTSENVSKGPPKKTEEELQEEEELQLALALSKSEAEHPKKDRYQINSSNPHSAWNSSSSIVSAPVQDISSDKDIEPELAKYLNRSYWEQQKAKKHQKDTALPSVPTSANHIGSPMKVASKTSEMYQTGSSTEISEFLSSLRSQLEIFVNRMKSNQSRGRPIANDTAVQTLFMNITAMHAQHLKYIQEQDDRRVYFEGLQDKITQIRDARAALDALREDHYERIRRAKEEEQRMRQMQMMQKLEIMRKKKHEYLEYQRQLALHKMAESEREIMSRSTGHQPQVMPTPYAPPVAYPPPQQVFPPAPNYVYHGTQGGIQNQAVPYPVMMSPSHTQGGVGAFTGPRLEQGHVYQQPPGSTMQPQDYAPFSMPGTVTGYSAHGVQPQAPVTVTAHSGPPPQQNVGMPVNTLPQAPVQAVSVEQPAASQTVPVSATGQTTPTQEVELISFD